MTEVEVLKQMVLNQESRIAKLEAWIEITEEQFREAAQQLKTGENNE